MDKPPAHAPSKGDEESIFNSNEADGKVRKRRKRKHKVRNDDGTLPSSSLSQSSSSRSMQVDDIMPPVDGENSGETAEAGWKSKGKQYISIFSNTLMIFTNAVVSFLNDTSIDYRQIASQLHSERKERAKIVLELPPASEITAPPELISASMLDHYTTKVFFY